MQGLHITDNNLKEEDHVIETPPEELVSSPSGVASQPMGKNRNRKSKPQKPKFDPTVIQPVTISKVGKLRPSNECADRILYYFRQSNDAEGVCWKSVTTKTKNFYWGEFQMYITQMALKHLKSRLSAWLREDGEDPDPTEFHIATHSRKIGDELEFCDEKAAQVHRDYIEKENDALWKLQVQTEASGSKMPTKLLKSVKCALFKEAASGETKGAIYGLGSAAPEFYSVKEKGSYFSSGSSGPSSEVLELRKQVVNLQEEARGNEERDKAIAEAVARVEEDHDKAIAEAIKEAEARAYLPMKGMFDNIRR